MRPAEQSAIAFISLMVPFVAFFSWYLLKRVQARMLEFLLTLVISTVPIHFLIGNARRLDRDHRDSPELIAGAAALAPATILFGGSIWALSLAKRKKITDGWRRLGLMWVGWTLVPSIAAWIMVPVWTYKSLRWIVAGGEPCSLQVAIGSVFLPSLIIAIRTDMKEERST